MFGRQTNWDVRLRRTTRIKHVERELFEATFAGIVGAVTGAVGGPPGVIAGAIIGFLVGLLSGAIAEREDARKAARDRHLDAEIGVTRGSLGTKWVRHAPPLIGAYSFPSATGRSTAHDTIPSEGPIPEDRS